MAWLRELWSKEVGKFDRNVLALSGGALTISIAFVNNLASAPVEWTLFLGLGWLALLISVSLVVGSYVPSKGAIEARMEEDDDKGDDLSDRAWKLSLAGGFAFVLGAGLLGTFVLLNLH